MQKPFSILALSVCAALAACTTTTIEVPGVYVMDIQQGNIVTQDMIDQLRPNMSKKQVLYILGSPMLIDPFHQKRWDYIYAEQPGGEARMQKRIALLFEGDELRGVQGDFRPSSVPVIPISKDVTVEVPKRESNDTLWDNFAALFKSSEPEPAVKEENAVQADDSSAAKSKGTVTVPETEKIEATGKVEDASPVGNDAQTGKPDAESKGNTGTNEQKIPLL